VHVGTVNSPDEQRLAGPRLAVRLLGDKMWLAGMPEETVGLAAVEAHRVCWLQFAEPVGFTVDAGLAQKAQRAMVAGDVTALQALQAAQPS
jgi:hypothetical protein